MRHASISSGGVEGEFVRYRSIMGQPDNRNAAVETWGYGEIVFGLLTDSEGCPVVTEVFDGNTGDPTTLATQIRKLRERFGLERVVLVGDRGMITSARIEEDLKQSPGLDWITALAVSP